MKYDSTDRSKTNDNDEVDDDADICCCTQAAVQVVQIDMPRMAANRNGGRPSAADIRLNVVSPSILL